MFCAKQPEFAQPGSCSKKEIVNNATACLDFKTIFVLESFSTQSFYFKVVLSPAPSTEPAASSRAQVYQFNIMMNARSNFAFLPPLLNYERMYANHHLYNELIEFLEKQSLGWTEKMASTVGKRFVCGRHVQGIISVWPCNVEDLKQ
jgi:hypothetical protein